LFSNGGLQWFCWPAPSLTLCCTQLRSLLAPPSGHPPGTMPLVQGPSAVLLREALPPRSSCPATGAEFWSCDLSHQEAPHGWLAGWLVGRSLFKPIKRL
jgi:hypothetical protein